MSRAHLYADENLHHQFALGTAFYSVAALAAKRGSDDPLAIGDYAAANLSVLALATEIWLKCLLRLSGKVVPTGRSAHDLDKLFLDLPDEDRDNARRVFEEELDASNLFSRAAPRAAENIRSRLRIRRHTLHYHRAPHLRLINALPRRLQPTAAETALPR